MWKSRRDYSNPLESNAISKFSADSITEYESTYGVDMENGMLVITNGTVRL